MTWQTDAVNDILVSHGYAEIPAFLDWMAAQGITVQLSDDFQNIVLNNANPSEDGNPRIDTLYDRFTQVRGRDSHGRLDYGSAFIRAPGDAITSVVVIGKIPFYRIGDEYALQNPQMRNVFDLLHLKDAAFFYDNTYGYVLPMVALNKWAELYQKEGILDKIPGMVIMGIISAIGAAAFGMGPLKDASLLWDAPVSAAIPVDVIDVSDISVSPTDFINVSPDTPLPSINVTPDAAIPTDVPGVEFEPGDVIYNDAAPDVSFTDADAPINNGVDFQPAADETVNPPTFENTGNTPTYEGTQNLPQGATNLPGGAGLPGAAGGAGAALPSANQLTSWLKTIISLAQQGSGSPIPGGMNVNPLAPGNPLLPGNTVIPTAAGASNNTMLWALAAVAAVALLKG